MSYFSIDKSRSLDIIRSIQHTTPENEDTDSENEDKWPACYKHKLAVVELALENANRGDIIDNFYDEIIIESNKGNNIGYNRSDSIDIASIDIDSNDCINLEAYLHGTRVECDWSYPSFMYDETLKTWIIKNNFWGAENGIGLDGIVTILDFNNYK
jgi:hypothetical protein